MSIWQAFWLALLQEGDGDLARIQSRPRRRMLPSLFGLARIDEESPTFLPFFVVLHLGTATALLVFFRWEWAQRHTGILPHARHEEACGGPRWAAGLAVFWPARSPPGSSGLILEKGLSANFARPALAASFLVLNGIMLLIGEQHLQAQADQVRRERAFFVAGYCGWHLAGVGAHSRYLALRPSRWSEALPPGLAPRLRPGSRFCLATPRSSSLRGSWRCRSSFSTAQPAPLRSRSSGGRWPGSQPTASSTALLMLLFRSREVEALGPFAGYYCIGAGLISLVLLLAR